MFILVCLAHIRRLIYPAFQINAPDGELQPLADALQNWFWDVLAQLGLSLIHVPSFTDQVIQVC